MIAYFKLDALRVAVNERGFRVKALALHLGVDVRTLERRFNEQFQTSPKAWIIRERMHRAPPLLAEGLSNKQIAAALDYKCEQNFCRAFKQFFGSAPQQFSRSSTGSFLSHFDKQLSRSDKDVKLQ